MRPTIVLGALLVAVAALAFWVVMDPADGTTMEGGGGGPAAARTEDAQADAPAGVGPVPGKDAVATSRFSERGKAVAPDATPTPTKTVTVEVYMVDVETGLEKVVPDIDVWFVRRNREVRARLESAGAEILDVAKQLGHPCRTGSDGRAEVPALPIGSALLAGLPGLMGRAETPRLGKDLIRLRLNALSAVPVRVVDSGGDPVAGVAVDVVDDAGRSFALGPVASDIDGLVELLIDTHRLAQRGGGQDARAKLAIPLSVEDAKACEVLVDLNALPPEPITLVMPSVGSVVVTLDTSGGWSPGRSGVGGRGGMVSMGRTGDNSNQGRAGALFGVVGGDWRAPVVGRTARFAHVGLGVSWDIRFSDDARFEAVAEGTAGPTRTGEEVQVPLTPQRPWPVVAFRVVDDDGVPRPGLDLEVDLWRSGGPLGLTTVARSTPSAKSVRTDSDGRGEYPMESKWGESWTRTLFICLRDANGGRDLANALRIDLSRDLPSGVTDLGDVVLAAAPVFISGIVIDDGGNPVEGAWASIEGKQRVHKYWGSVSTGGPIVVSGADGRFLVRSFEKGHEIYRISFSKPGFSHRDGIEFTPGATGLRVSLGGAGRVHGRVLLPDGFENHSNRERFKRLYLHAVMTDEDAAEEELGNASVRGSLSVFLHDGALKFDSVPPGVYQLSITSDHNKVLAKIRGLSVRAGETCADPRLDPIDLRDTVQVLEVTVVGSSGAPIKDARVDLIWQRPISRWTTGAEGKALFVVPEDLTGFQLKASKSGFMTAHVEDIQRQPRMTLEPSSWVLIRVSPSVLSNLKSCVLSVALEAVDPKSPRVIPEYVRFVPGQDMRISPPTPGAYRLVWTLWEPTGHGGRRGWTVETGSEQVVEIKAGDRDRLVIAELTAADVQSALDRK